MTTTADQARAKIAKLFTNMDRLDLVVNGDAGTDVATDGGTVPSIAKLISQFTVHDGWTPLLSVTSDGARRVVGITDWQGGPGDKPQAPLYLGNGGLVTDIADANDIRGPAGDAASAGVVDSFGDGTATDVAPSVRVTAAALAGKMNGSTLAADAGATNIGTKRSLTGAASQTVAAVLAEFLPTATGQGAAVDGTTDARAALATLTSVPFRLTTGLYKVASSITFNQPVVFDPGARLVIPAGVTVTFNGGIIADRYQIFNTTSTGAVAGLWEVKMEWFAGDARDTTIECRALIQKAFNANVVGGLVTAGPGYWVIDGSTPIDTIASSFQGAGRASTTFFWQGAATNGFWATNASYSQGYLRDFRFMPLTAGTIPTSGTAIYIKQSYKTVSNFYLGDCYDGIVWENMVIGSASNFWISGARNRGHATVGAISQHTATDFTIESANEWVTLTSITGTFNVGDTVTFSGGAVANITASYGGGKYRMFCGWFDKPVVGNTATSSSGGHATLSALTIGHAAGGISMTNSGTAYHEEVIFRDGGVLGGEYGMLAVGKGSAGRAGNFGYCEIGTGVDIDTTWSGSTLNGWFGGYVNGWFASTRVKDSFGLALVNCQRLRGSPHVVNNAGAGIQWDNTSTFLEWHNIDCEGNNTNFSAGAAANMADIRILGAATDWTIIGGRAGFVGSSGVTPQRAIYVDTGADRLRVACLDVPSGSVLNNSSASDQTWFGVAGSANREPLAKYTNAANDSAAATAGVPVGGQYRNGSILMIRAV